MCNENHSRQIMMKQLIFILLVFLVSSCVERTNENNEIPKDLLIGDKVELRQGETFSIELGLNYSTGYSNCWINETKCDNVEIIEMRYVSSQREKDGCIGCSGKEYWNFKANNIGVDTIKIKMFFTEGKQRNCVHFQEDSLSYNEMTEHTPEVDRKIIVTVTK